MHEGLGLKNLETLWKFLKDDVVTPDIGRRPKNRNGGWPSTDGCRPLLDPFPLAQNNLAGINYMH